MRFAIVWVVRCEGDGVLCEVYGVLCNGDGVLSEVDDVPSETDGVLSEIFGLLSETDEVRSETGYGERGAGGVIPPNASLIFIIEVLETK